MQSVARLLSEKPDVQMSLALCPPELVSLRKGVNGQKIADTMALAQLGLFFRDSLAQYQSRTVIASIQAMIMIASG